MTPKALTGSARWVTIKQIRTANAVTLALGLNDVYRVPMRALKKAFATQPHLADWRDAWLDSLRLLGE